MIRIGEQALQRRDRTTLVELWEDTQAKRPEIAWDDTEVQAACVRVNAE